MQDIALLLSSDIIKLKNPQCLRGDNKWLIGEPTTDITRQP